MGFFSFLNAVKDKVWSSIKWLGNTAKLVFGGLLSAISWAFGKIKSGCCSVLNALKSLLVGTKEKDEEAVVADEKLTNNNVGVSLASLQWKGAAEDVILACCSVLNASGIPAMVKREEIKTLCCSSLNALGLSDKFREYFVMLMLMILIVQIAVRIAGFHESIVNSVAVVVKLLRRVGNIIESVVAM